MHESLSGRTQGIAPCWGHQLAFVCAALNTGPGTLALQSRPNSRLFAACRTGLAQGVRYDQASTRSLMLVSFYGPDLDAQGLELQTQCLVALSTATSPFVQALKTQAQRLQAGDGYQGVDMLAVFERYAALAEQRGLQGWLESTESGGAARGVLAGFVRTAPGDDAALAAGESDDEDEDAGAGELIEDSDPKKKRRDAAAEGEVDGAAEAEVVDAAALEAAEAFEEAPEELPEVDEDAELEVATGGLETAQEDTALTVTEAAPAPPPPKPQGALGAAVGALKRALTAQGRGEGEGEVEQKFGGELRGRLERAAKDTFWQTAMVQVLQNVEGDVESCVRSAGAFEPQAQPIFALAVLEVWAVGEIRSVVGMRLREEWLASFLRSYEEGMRRGEAADVEDSNGTSLLAALQERCEDFKQWNEDRDYITCLGWCASAVAALGPCRWSDLPSTTLRLGRCAEAPASPAALRAGLYPVTCRSAMRQ